MALRPACGNETHLMRVSNPIWSLAQYRRETENN
jgi:hypothetical protein